MIPAMMTLAAMRVASMLGLGVEADFPAQLFDLSGNQCEDLAAGESAFLGCVGEDGPGIIWDCHRMAAAFWLGLNRCFRCH
jgi:hypothetical protein